MVEGYAYYRVKDEWEDGFAKGEVRVVEALATSVEAEKALWTLPARDRPRRPRGG